VRIIKGLRIGILIVSLFLLAFTGSVLADHESDPPDKTIYEWLNQETTEDYAHIDHADYDMNNSNPGIYFSGGYYIEDGLRDLDSFSEEERKDVEEKIDSRLESDEYEKFDDATFQTYPTDKNIWNRGNAVEWSDYRNHTTDPLIPEHRKDEFTTFDSFSTIRQVSGTSIPSGPLARDAHITIYSVQNSSYIHRYRTEGSNYDKSRFYFGTESDVYAIFDAQYSSEPPTVSTGDSLGSKRYSYDITEQSLENVKINLHGPGCPESGCSIGTGENFNGTIIGSYEVPTEQISAGDDYSIEVTGEIVIEIEEEVEDRVDTGEDMCVDWTYSGTTATCTDYEDILEWEDQPEATETYTYDTTLSDTLSGTFQPGFNVDSNSEDVTVRKAIYPNGDVEGEIDFNINTDDSYPTEPWHRFTINNDTVYSGWEYFTSREKRWDDMYTSDGEDYASAVRPVNAHAYRTTFSATPAESSDVRVINTDTKFTSAEYFMPRLSHHRSCWQDFPEDESNPEDAKHCYWTQTASGVVWFQNGADLDSESGDSGGTFSSQYSMVPQPDEDRTTEDETMEDIQPNEFQKNPYVTLSYTDSVQFESFYDFEEVTTHGIVGGSRTDTVDRVYEVKDLEMSVEQVDPDDLSNCYQYAVNCPQQPEEGELLLRANISDEDGDPVTQEFSGIKRVYVENSQRNEYGRLVDSEATVVGTAHYIYVDANIVSGTSSVQVEATDWTELEGNEQPYVSISSSANTQTSNASDGILRALISFGVIFAVVITGAKIFLRSINAPEPNLEDDLIDMVITNDIVRLFLTIGIILLILDVITGGMVF
jgi:hypothetical protein